jgi:hypothetical protein
LKVHAVRTLLKVVPILKLEVLASGFLILAVAADPLIPRENQQIVAGDALSLNNPRTDSLSSDLANLPKVIFEDGIENWAVDRFAGNNTAGPIFYQGPALEAGSLQNPDWCLEGGDGTIYLVTAVKGAVVPRLMKVDPEGNLRLFMDNRGLIEGRVEECQAGWPVWNSKEKAIYLVGRHCLRKVEEKPNGTKWVEVVAGVPSPIPCGFRDKREPRDGPATKAIFTHVPRHGVVCNSEGTFYWLEGTDVKRALRKIQNGTVSTVPLHFKDQGEFIGLLYEGGMLSLGENDDTLYINSMYSNNGVFRCDLKTGVLTRVVGIKKGLDTFNRAGVEADGPAMTHAGFNGSVYELYDPFYNAIWLTAQDSVRVRWLRLDGDGWVRTVFGSRRVETRRHFDKYKDTNIKGVPGEQFSLGGDSVIRFAGIDSQGGVYIKIHHHEGSGFWRAYNKNWADHLKKEVKP